MKSKVRRVRQETDERFYHGVFAYAFPHIVYENLLRASDNHILGHDFTVPGVYLSKKVKTARGYARPHVVIDAWRPMRFIFEVCAPPQKHKQRKRSEFVFDSENVF